MAETLAILAVVLLLALQFVVPFTRYMVKRQHARTLYAPGHGHGHGHGQRQGGPLLQQAPAGIHAFALPRRPAAARGPEPGKEPGQAPGTGQEQLNGTFDLARIEGRVRDSSVRKVHAIVERHPGEALHLLRHWMHKSA